MKLTWRTWNDCYGFKAETKIGSYAAHDLTVFGYRGGYAAFFRPAQGRARSPKDRQPLGNFDTMEEAKPQCEQHARETADRTRLSNSATFDNYGGLEDEIVAD